MEGQLGLVTPGHLDIKNGYKSDLELDQIIQQICGALYSSSANYKIKDRNRSESGIVSLRIGLLAISMATRVALALSYLTIRLHVI